MGYAGVRRNVSWHPTAGLWWAAFATALLGTAIAYVFYLDRTNPSAKLNLSVTVLLTTLVGGLLVICATAHLWMRR